MSQEVNAGQIARLRLQTQQLVQSTHTNPAQAVQGMLAMQAQDFGAMQWAVGARVPGATAQTIVDAFDSGKIVRSWPMRGTLHVVAAQDLRWILDLTATRTLAGAATRLLNLELDEATLKQAETVATETLSGNRCATREEMMNAFASQGISTDNQRGYHILWHLAHTGLVCWGPISGTQQALVLSEEWIPPTPSLDREQALGELVLRYLHGHGPATLKDFIWWTKLTTTDAKSGWEIARKHLVELRCNNISYWMTTDTYKFADANLAEAKQSVLALPGYDEYLLGYQDRSLVLAEEHAPRITPGNNGVFQPTIVVGGTVVGTWKRRTTKVKTTIAPSEFVPLSQRTQKSFALAVDAYGKFLGSPASVAES